MITVLSLISLGTIGSNINIPNKDKYVHFIFYFVFVVLWFSQTKDKNISKRNKIIVLFSAIGYGIFMEICQGFTETRTPDVMDALANSIGAISGLVFITSIYKYSKRKLSQN